MFDWDAHETIVFSFELPLNTMAAIVIFASVRFPGETPDLFDPDSCPMIGRYVNLEQSEGYYQGQFVAVDSRPGNIGSTRVPNLSSIPSYTRTPLFCQH